MRKPFALAVLAATVALALPAAPASAVCEPLTSRLLGRCSNPCYLVPGVYDSVNHATHDRLPALVAECQA
ncbi:MAG: hypothetical protein QOE45_2701 [Frankiaceae bacterium]|jgi:hypothetical protein|nr:hypothetical protein [Frankiaceae bacterium]